MVAAGSHFTVAPHAAVALPHGQSAGGVQLAKGWSCAVFMCDAVMALVTAATAFCVGVEVPHVAQTGATAARAPARLACVRVP